MMGLSGPRSQRRALYLLDILPQVSRQHSISSHPNHLATMCSIECDRATGLCEDQEKGVEWTRQGAPPARPTALGTHLWKTLGQAATGGDRCCRPPPQSISGGAASAVRQQGGQHACRCCHAACSHASHSLMIETEREWHGFGESLSFHSLCPSVFELLKSSSKIRR